MLATQTLYQKKSMNMRVVIDGKLPPGVTAKDIFLAIIGEVGGGGRHRLRARIRRRGDRGVVDGRPHDGLQHVGRGRRQGWFHRARRQGLCVSEGSPESPKGAAWDAARRDSGTLRSDDGAQFHRDIKLDAARLPPLVTWGTSPEQVVSVTGRVPVPADLAEENKRIAAETSLAYMGLKGGEKMTDITIDRVFIGSCTNGRLRTFGPPRRWSTARP